MSDNVNFTDFNGFLDALNDPGNATDMSFMDLLEPIGYDRDHVAHDGGLGPAPEPDALPGDDLGFEAEGLVVPNAWTDWLDPGMIMDSNEASLERVTGSLSEEFEPLSAPAAQPDALHTKALSLPSEHACEECGENFPREFKLWSHVRETLHRGLRCQVAGCNQTFISLDEREAHERRPHLDNHGRAETAHSLACIECQAQFRNKAKLQKHANEAQHSPFACVCGKKFARLDVLNRHLDSLGDGMPKYPCSFCKKHRGKDGFRRRDHLLQHVRGYHKFEAEGKIGDILPSRRGRYQAPLICTHRDCTFYRDDSFQETFKEMTPEEQKKNRPFRTQSEYTKHMKTVHDFTPFPCTVVGCSKTGKKGYTREKDLINHRRKEHPEAGEYVAKTRDVRLSCLHPGCNAKLDPNSMSLHMGIKHKVWFE